MSGDTAGSGGAPEVVLGSQSKWRRRLLADAGIAHSTASADIDEKAITIGDGDRATADPSALTLAIAKAKADALLPSFADKRVLLITSDQVVAHAGRIREKPTSEAECRAYLASYTAEPACTVTAVVVTDSKTGRQVAAVDIAKQHFKAVPEEVVTALIAKGDIMYCAGGFMVDDPLLEPYLGTRVGDESSIIGLPIPLTRRLLADVVAHPPAAAE